MKAWCAGLVVAFLGMGWTGCGKPPSGSNQAGSNAPAKSGGGANPLTAPVDYLGAVGAAQKQAVKVVDLTTLQQAIQAFQAGEDRLPSSLQELVTEGYLPRLPATPAGMRFAYDAQRGQVRLVPAAPTSAPAR